MRQVNKDMIEALRYPRSKNIGGNTRVKVGIYDTARVVLHQTIIFKRWHGTISFNHGGWLSNVTFDRLQAIASMYGFTMHRDGNGFYIQTPHDIFKLPCTLTLHGNKTI